MTDDGVQFLIFGLFATRVNIICLIFSDDVGQIFSMHDNFFELGISVF